MSSTLENECPNVSICSNFSFSLKNAKDGLIFTYHVCFKQEREQLPDFFQLGVRHIGEERSAFWLRQIERTGGKYLGKVIHELGPRTLTDLGRCELEASEIIIVNLGTFSFLVDRNHQQGQACFVIGVSRTFLRTGQGSPLYFYLVFGLVNRRSL